MLAQSCVEEAKDVSWEMGWFPLSHAKQHFNLT